ncbi:hypothetical protein K9M78_08395 [Candidatus Bipolaricaulota bacterium]|nr:hypothetical protein [Candidatus Bipolaricaulota bacterium]
MRYCGGNLRLCIAVVLSFAVLVAFSGATFAVGPYGHDFGRMFSVGDLVVDIGKCGPYRADFGRLFSAGDSVVDIVGGPYHADFGRLLAVGYQEVDIVGGPYRADFRY